MRRVNRVTSSIITPPAVAVLSAAQMRARLVIETISDDALLDSLVAAATSSARQFMRRSIVTETLEARMDGVSGTRDIVDALGQGMHTGSYPYITGTFASAITLPFGPVQSIVSVTSFARDDTPTVMNAALYGHDASRIYLHESSSWPSDLRAVDAIAIRYTSGTALADVPAPIVQAIAQHVAAMYECRAACAMPEACRALLAEYRMVDMLAW